MTSRASPPSFARGDARPFPPPRAQPGRACRPDGRHRPPAEPRQAGRLTWRRTTRMANRTLIRNAIVLSQDDSIGEIPRADVLVEGDTIADVRPDIAADD